MTREHGRVLHSAKNVTPDSATRRTIVNINISLNIDSMCCPSA